MTANAVTPLKAAEAAMWRLVQRYTGKAGYRHPVKAEGLTADPPVIDCSGWTALLLTEAVAAANAASGRTMFDASYVATCRPGRTASSARSRAAQD